MDKREIEERKVVEETGERRRPRYPTNLVDDGTEPPLPPDEYYIDVE
jgi:hypothetical protein